VHNSRGRGVTDGSTTHKSEIVRSQQPHPHSIQSAVIMKKNMIKEDVRLRMEKNGNGVIRRRKIGSSKMVLGDPFSSKLSRTRAIKNAQNGQQIYVLHLDFR
jgi:tagatose-1,6-bisphosphate aldolase